MRRELCCGYMDGEGDAVPETDGGSVLVAARERESVWWKYEWVSAGSGYEIDTGRGACVHGWKMKCLPRECNVHIN
jgi:hypothetical protein